MLITNERELVKATRKNHQLRRAIANWMELAARAEWNSIIDVRQTFPTADFIANTNLTCFDILGNAFRLMTVVSYKYQQIQIVELLTHKEYDRKY